MYEKVLEVKGTAKGTIRRIMPDIGFGAIWDKKNKQDVYFSTVTEFTNTSYEELNEGDIVEVLVVRTARGLFAKNLSLKEVCPIQETEISPSL
ncbi:MAG: cold shock domain-containing protein [Bdellovibrionales bacterium]|nr:cold shock domain-containing protein [Bdellovibrionales bacterium]